eukprot:CAMPEP_0175138306 /NCGR_PEP_ID=MMETSP0087-20121206/10276_1 /TAXON_ID=136419 /ORGANISM="Unknown Unknown, Strain D1" /LENGTH=1035 /DNA_ID=CAMNT_0016421195 /DNA_START=32 /DNA_END=3139 /DNA_ORIENTATION=-
MFSRVLMLCVVLFASTCHALLEAKAGVTDWYQSNIGKVKQAVFNSHQSSTAFVITDSAVLAALDLRTGQLQWKQVLPEGETVDSVKVLDKQLITLSDGGDIVRYWNARDGSLRWDSGTHAADNTYAMLDTDLKLQLQRTQRSPAPAATGTTSQALAFVSKSANKAAGSVDMAVLTATGAVYLVDGQTGRRVWTWSPDAAAGLGCSSLTTSGYGKDAVVHVVCLSSVDFVVKTLSASSGAVVNELVEQEVLAKTSVQVTQNGVVLLLPNDGKGVRVFSLQGSKPIEQERVEMNSKNAVFVAAHNLHRGAVVRTSSGELVLLSSEAKGAKGGAKGGGGDQDGKAQCLAADNKGSSSSSCLAQVSIVNRVQVQGQGQGDKIQSFAVGSGNTVDTTTLAQYSGGKVTFVSLATGKPSAAFSFPSRAGICKLAISTSPGRKGAYRYLISAADHSLSLVQNSKVVWTREEALARVSSAVFIDLRSEYTVGEGFPGFLNRFSSKIDFIAKQAQSVMSGEMFADYMAARADLTADSSHIVQGGEIQSLGMAADTFGFRKLVVVLTEANKVLGLDSLTGKIVWTRLLFSADATHTQTGAEAVRLFVHGQGAGSVAVLCRHGDSHEVVHLDATSGEETSRKVLPFRVNHVVPLPLTDSQDNQLVMLVDDTHQPHILPDSDEAASLFAAHAKNVFYYNTDVVTGEVSGYALNRAAAGGGGGGGAGAGQGFRGEQVWSVVFPPDVEAIASIAASRGDNVESAVRVLSSKAYVNKYLNPNLLVIATVRGSPPAGARVVPSVKSGTDPCVNVYFVDAVTGAIMNKLVHKHGKGPVRLLQSENVVVFTYWNVVNHQHEVSVVEMHEDAEDYKQGGGSFSSFSGVSPKLVQQAFVLREGVRAIGVTSTARGITEKQFLFVTNSNKLVGVGRRLLDVRRPLGDTPTPEEQEAGVVPYMKEIPLDGLSTLSYNRTISRVRGVVTYPALIESTSLVFCFGLELFFTRVNPSAMFDSLNEDFNYVFLIGTVTAVMVGIVISKKAGQRKDLAAKWK